MDLKELHDSYISLALSDPTFLFLQYRSATATNQARIAKQMCEKRPVSSPFFPVTSAQIDYISRGG